MHKRLAAAALLFAGAAWAQSAGVWQSRAPVPIATTEASAVAIGNKVYLTCGITPDNLRNRRLFIYDVDADRWSEGAPLPISLGGDHCNLAAVAGKAYFVGGIRLGRGFLTNQTFVYDPAADNWSELSRQIVPRGASGVAAIGEVIYVAGGEGAQNAGADFEAFDTRTNRWETLPPLPSPRTHLTAQVVGGVFYAIGGRTGSIAGVQPDVFAYDPAARQWSRKAPMPTARGGVASGVIDGRIIVFGGEGPSGRAEQTYEEVEEYDPATDRWRSLTPMPSPRHGFYGATVRTPGAPERVFLPTGGPVAGASFSQTNDVFLFAPATPPSITTSGLVSAASFTGPPVGGALLSLFGERLALGSAEATALPLPTTLGGVDALIGGTPAPLLFVSPGQINLQAPFGVIGPTPVEVRSFGATASQTIDFADAAPAVFSLDLSGSGQGAVLVAGTVADSQRPARRGEILEIFGTGFGAVTNPPPAGEAASGSPLSETAVQPTVRIGGVTAEVLFSGLAPGLVGVNQVNALVPAEASSGDAVAVEIVIGAAVSNPVTVAIE